MQRLPIAGRRSRRQRRRRHRSRYRANVDHRRVVEPLRQRRHTRSGSQARTQRPDTTGSSARPGPRMPSTHRKYRHPATKEQTPPPAERRTPKPPQARRTGDRERYREPEPKRRDAGCHLVRDLHLADLRAVQLRPAAPESECRDHRSRSQDGHETARGCVAEPSARVTSIDRRREEERCEQREEHHHQARDDPMDQERRRHQDAAGDHASPARRRDQRHHSGGQDDRIRREVIEAATGGLHDGERAADQDRVQRERPRGSSRTSTAKAPAAPPMAMAARAGSTNRSIPGEGPFAVWMSEASTGKPGRSAFGFRNGTGIDDNAFSPGA